MSDDIFPSYPRYLYARAPLVQVVCQLRFPPILRIEAEPPAAFQDGIRGSFPLVERAALPQLPGQQIPPDVMQLLAANIKIGGYKFLTENRQTSVDLTADTITLSTNSYLRWEGFRQDLHLVFMTLCDVYRPAFFSRLGLRYTNAIQRAKLGLSDVPWSRLLRPEILGEIALPQFEANLSTVRRMVWLKSPSGQSVILQHGLATISGSAEPVYTIDCDFFKEEKTEVGDAEQILDELHTRARDAFRWCITDQLHESLGPTELAE
jgi:uncharacterized protein (TIGR04255 family)